MLNVQQVRLRFISARFLTSVPSISKGLRKGASTAPSIFKRLTAKAFQNRHGWRWFHTVASFSLEKLVVEQCTRTYTVHPRHGRRWFHAVASFSLEKLVVEQCTRTYTVHPRQGRRWFHAVASFSLEKLVVEQCTRMCASQQAISAFCRRRRSLR
ncbi:hypothetical protein [uncultured Treponema sp.]|uniref:hypothetical protein n=1 Tax=uncultured Treponema sp. TaxID=162155 RepID=UPI0028E450E2|nr:hypothetical protein [uncultured Treponema sp.]